MPAKNINKNKAEQTHFRILAAAEKIFRSYGYHKTTVADIAAELGMSPANIYRFFKSKQAINEALAAVMLGEAEAALEQIVARKTSADDRLQAFILALFDTTLQRYVEDHKVHDMVLAALSESWGVIQQHIDRVTELVKDIVASGIADGTYPAQDAEAAALCIHAALAPFTHPVLVTQCSQSEGHDAMRAQAMLVAHFCCIALRAGFHPDPALVAATRPSRLMEQA